MESAAITDRVRAVLASVLEIDPGQIDQDFGPARADNWDSFANLRIISALEKEFALKFGWNEIQRMTDLASITGVIALRVP